MADRRRALFQQLRSLLKTPSGIDQLLTPESQWDLAWPLNQAVGPEDVQRRFFDPLLEAFDAPDRRDLLFIGGDNIREAGGYWCAAVCHYVGMFRAPFLGVAPSHHLAFLRSGEFYRLDAAGRITEAKIIFDLVDLMRQARRMPLPSLGTETTFPAPETQDGLCPDHGDGGLSLDLIQRMLGDLHEYDPKTNASKGQIGAEGAWADNFMWYGPAGVGSNKGWQGFVDDHRKAFLEAFPDRQGGNHFCRIGDGNYAAISGWPSMTMTHRAPYLGQPGDGRALTLRVMDFYRCDFDTHASGKIAENWVCLDYGHLFHQMGRDLIAESNALPEAPA